MDKRELRLAVEQKFNHRKRLLSENIRLKGRLDDYNQILRSKLGVYAADRCADAIAREIIDTALQTAEMVAEFTPEMDCVVGINIPAKSIRLRLTREDLVKPILDGPEDAVEFANGGAGE